MQMANINSEANGQHMDLFQVKVHPHRISLLNSPIIKHIDHQNQITKAAIN
jgi:hypothetical protein